MKPWWLAVAAAVGIVIGYLLFRGKPPDPVIIFRADTVLADSARFLAARDSALKAAKQAEAEARRAHAAASHAVAWADSVANSVPNNGAIVPDSGTVPRVAYDSLRVAYTSLDSAYRYSTERAGRLLAQVVADSSRIAALTGQVTDLRNAYAKTRTHRCSLGGAVGYGAVLAGTVRTGPAVVAGVSCKL